MKIFLIPLICLILGSCSRSNSAFSLRNTHLKDLLERKEFFRLREYLEKNEGVIQEGEKLLYLAHSQGAFLKCQESNSAIDLLLSSYASNITDSLQASLLKLRLENNIKLAAYSEASKNSTELLSKYSSYLTTKEKADYENTGKLWRALSSAPKQSVTITNDFVTPLNQWNIPVNVEDSTFHFVFDTGADLSVVSKSYSKVLGLQEIEVGVDVNASAGFKNKANVGIAPFFKIGNIEIRNAVFLIFPDEALTFPGNFFIKGIIGFPVIREFKEITIRKGEELFISPQVRGKSLRNLAMDGLKPVVNLQVGSDTLAFTLDTGADKTALNYLYYKTKTDFVQNTGVNKKVKIGGVGGIKELEVYELPQVHLQSNLTKLKLDNVVVHTESHMETETFFYGNAGEDLINQCDEVIINFEEMSIEFMKDN